jgi:hypothetical protein
MFNNTLVLYIWMNILYHSKNIFASSIEYFIHVNDIYLYKWKIFGLFGKNII